MEITRANLNIRENGKGQNNIMDTDSIIDGIVERRESVGMTYQQIADASGISRSTVMRILQKQTTQPSLKNLADIAMAVGYDLDPVQPAVLQDHTKDSYITYLQEALEAERKISDKRVTAMRFHYNMLISEKNRWIKYAFIAIIALVAFLVGWLIIDILVPSAGWIQRAINGRYETNNGVLDSFLYNVWAWLETS